MLEIAKDTFIALFISLVSSAVFAPIMIGFMYKFNQVSVVTKNKQGLGGGTNSMFLRIMNRDKTNGTPNMGGLMIMVIVPIVAYFLVGLTPQIKILLLSFIIFGLWGLADVLFTNAIRANEKLKAKQESFGWRMMKLFLGILINTGVTYLLFKTGTFNEISLWKGLTISVVPFLIPVIGTVGQFAIYSAELTDGLDGLMMGIMGIIYTGLGVLLALKGDTQFLPIVGIILGAIIVDLYFNIPPARFWNGGPGAMPLGYAAFFIALVTGNLIPYFIISSITWGIMSSSMIQILSMKFFKRRVFKIAPIHHHFQAIGWPQYKVTMRFWLFTAFTVVVGVFVGIVI